MKVLSGMFLGLILICFSSVAVASEKLQTEITKEDLRIIDKLLQIAQKNSYEVRKAKYETGFNAFADTVSIQYRIITISKFDKLQKNPISSLRMCEVFLSV